MASTGSSTGTKAAMAAVAFGIGLTVGQSGLTFTAPKVGDKQLDLDTHQERGQAGIPATDVQSTITPTVVASAVGAAAAVGLIARQAMVSRPATLPKARTAKVVRNFFGDSGSSGYSRFEVTTQYGVQDPVGFWDPLGLASDGDEATFMRRRSVELKHGRICMAATIGYIVPEYFKFPGYLSPSNELKFSDVPNGLAALSKVPAIGWVQIVFFAGIMEGCFGFDDYKNGTPGEYGWKVLTSSDPAEKEKKLKAEIANGRLAMVAIIGMFFQDGLTGSAWGDWALYTGSPLRAFESELGVQAPVGYWDPLGLAKDGDPKAFARRRASEVKHGRICMLAAMGYITPELTGKFPGYLSISLDLKFTDIPNGLAAVSKVPFLGWMQILAWGAFCELNGGYNADVAGTPGNLGWRPPLLATDDDAIRKRRLNAELANGRLAMMAVIGMFFQDGLTGCAWGDWSAYTDSPLRAFENALGAQAPLGFWDPLGLSSDGDEYSFRRRRSVEIKHGRICMLATMGYITPEVAGRWPGFLSPSTGLKFSDIPNGLGAFSKVPFTGWLQIFGWCFFCELNGKYDADVKKEPGNVGWKPPLLSGGDDATRKRRLSAELANGRLAMVAIIGMFFQDGLTGSAWGDWAQYTDSPLRAFESELGVQEPVGFWDPLGLSSDGDVQSFRRRRTVELKHGRISMLATMGYITPEITGKFPGDLSPSAGLKFADVPNGLAAISKVPALGWAQIVAYSGFCELSAGSDDWKTGTPGDYGFKVLTSSDPAEKQKKLAAEIANGRLAMVAIIGMFFQDGLTGSAWGDWASYTDSPLRAFESELGVQDPVGFWDPAGFSNDGDTTAFRRRRTVELKHGRISMLATMGYITPEITGKFPGDLSPSAGLKFADIPNGLAAISKVPALGWAQIVAYSGFCELSAGSDDWKTGTPGDYGFKVLTSSDPQEKTKKLAAEIANGRLAMVAIIGMFFQDGLTGSAWGDWALYTDSPLRAFENELGVQSPVGFYDPVGFSADGDVRAFRRRRSVELKHGRISMLACMGYITPELTGKFPGFLSPSLNLKFADIPNGLDAVAKVPALGWAQIAAYFGFVEFLGGFDDYKTGTPGDYGWKALTSSDPETRQTKLQAELANGRLAMVAIIAMFVQNGITGTTGPEMWAGEAPGGRALAFESELGVQAPVGYWDPLGLAKDGDAGQFRRRRVTEIKHGRVAMYACMGYIAPEYFRFPGYLSPSAGLKFVDVPNGLEALGKVPLNGWLQIVLFAGLYELPTYNDEGKEPGDLGWKALTSSDPEVRKRKLNAELANGRLAMVAIMGMLFQNGTVGSTGPDMWLPGSAFEGEMGVQAPVGFWDPAGFAADGDAKAFRRRRETEIKHGRVSMIACLGYIVPEYFKWPGLLSPSTGLKFTDIPSGLAAASKVPAAGWVQMFLFAGLLDFAYFQQEDSRGPGDFKKGGILGVPNGTGPMPDAEARKRKLNAEIANGRLAMMAIIGMFFQDGLTGAAWGDWANYVDSPLRGFEGELGVQAPVGFWDPAGFCADGDKDAFNRRRATELKHGRVSMIACLGYIVPEYYHWPGYCSPSKGIEFSNIPNGLAALSKVPGAGWVQIFLFCGVVEKLLFVADDTRPPGDFVNGGVLGVPNGSTLMAGDGRTKKLNAEIANGRLAMMAVIGMFFQDGLTGGAWSDWSLYTDSPLRAFESELGVQAPVGYWDPLGLSKDGDKETFTRRRWTEIKHGRLCMWACLGYIVPEYFKWPGLLSPSENISFADIPNGLGALAKVPGAGWLQIFVFCGAVEKGLFEQDDSRAPGDYKNGGVLGVPNGTTLQPGDSKNRKLNAEIANGRLAMMAIIGMFFQDGLTGQAWGDWAMYTDSPLRAKRDDAKVTMEAGASGSFNPSGEMGAMDPLGYWDPCGFCKDNKEATFRKYRGAELKHGRVSMLCIVGFIAQHFYRIGGFEDVPDGLAALRTSTGGSGFAVLFLLGGFFELRILAEREDPNEPGKFDDPFKMINSSSGGYDAKWRNMELNNGRLAMFGAIGTIAANAYTGKDAFEQWQCAKPVAIDFIKRTLPFAP